MSNVNYVCDAEEPTFYKYIMFIIYLVKYESIFNIL